VPQVALTRLRGVPRCAPQIVFIIGEEVLNELRLRMLTVAQFAPSPKNVARSAMRQLGVPLHRSRRWNGGRGSDRMVTESN